MPLPICYANATLRASSVRLEKVLNCLRSRLEYCNQERTATITETLGIYCKVIATVTF